MKHTYTILLLFCLLIAACKKDNTPVKPQDDQKKYEVKFNATAFSQEYADFKNNALGNRLKSTAVNVDTNTYAIRLNIIDNQGNIVYTGQTSEYGGNLGQFSLMLPVGTYKAVFTGMYEYYYKYDRYYEYRTVYFAKNSDFYYVTTLYEDYGPTDTERINREIFLKEIPLIIPQTNQTQNVSLKRITSRLQVNIKDVIPAAATRMDIGVTTTYHRYSSGPDKYLNPENSSFYTDLSKSGAVGNSTHNLDILVPPNSNHIVTIWVYNGTELLAKKVITDVVCSPNQITLLRGNLFGGTSSGNTTDTQVKVDTTWNSTVINKSF